MGISHGLLASLLQCDREFVSAIDAKLQSTWFTHDTLIGGILGLSHHPQRHTTGALQLGGGCQPGIGKADLLILFRDQNDGHIDVAMQSGFVEIPIQILEYAAG